jgi:hypothetical protein
VGLDLLRPESALPPQSLAQIAGAFAFNLGQIEYDFVLPQGLDQCGDEARVASGGGRKVFNRAPTVETVRQSTQQAPGRPVDLQHTLIRLDDRASLAVTRMSARMLITGLALSLVTAVIADLR